MAARLHWMPDSLQNSAISAIACSYEFHKKDIRSLPNNLLTGVLYKLYKQNMFKQLACELVDLDVMFRLLLCKGNGVSLHQMFQGLLDERLDLARILTKAFAERVCSSQRQCSSVQERTVSSGLALGSFFIEAGWYEDAEITLYACLQLAKSRCTKQEDKTIAMAAECCLRLLVALNSNCKYEQANKVYQAAYAYFEELDRRHVALLPSKPAPSSTTPVAISPVNRAALYGYYCSLLLARSQYDAAYLFAEAALKQLQESLPSKTVVDVLRIASKACVIKREFAKAEILIRNAINIAWEDFGKNHPKFADALIDYGFYLLNVDCIAQAVVVYQLALSIRKHCFTSHGNGCNIVVASAHEDLGYATYVFVYSTGHFQKAQFHAERSIEILTHILPENHLLLASSKRVKALILEEIAIDSNDKEAQMRKLTEAEELHTHSLNLAKAAFGENNVQTAKHYGNLGRLYQSKKNYRKAEEMHLKAIEIKEHLLGPDDYEVALSVGHLASLYNYDMEKYPEAEQLYLRSISIGKKLFGDGYSGLEYDYRGLLRLYHRMRDWEKAHEFQVKLHDWASLREQQMDEASDSSRQKWLADRLTSEADSPLTSESMTLDSLKRQFFASPSRFPKDKSAFNLVQLHQGLDGHLSLN